MYSEPPEAKIPKTRWRLYPFKENESLCKLHVYTGINTLVLILCAIFLISIATLYIHRQSAYLIGRDRRVSMLS